VTLATERPPAPQTDAEFGVAVLGSAWHAVDLANPPLMRPVHRDRLSACGHLVKLTDKWGTFHELRDAANPPELCPRCLWTVAIRTGHTEEELDRLAAAVSAAPLPARVVLDVARVILIIADPHERDEQADPRVVELLSSVTRHTPVPLGDPACSDGDCDHRPRRRGGSGCPTTGWACPTCSLRLGPWAGDERSDEFEPDAIVPPPCQVLGAVRRVLPGLSRERRRFRS
jgi:hypothetical protein